MTAAQDAIALLKADHDALAHLFAAYGRTRSLSDRKALVSEICTALNTHAQVSEEIFYPAVLNALKGPPPLSGASAGPAGMKDLMAQLQGADPGGDRYDATVRMLWERVKHHVRQEQTEMFPRAWASSLDLIEVGARMAARKDDLLARIMR